MKDPVNVRDLIDEEEPVDILDPVTLEVRDHCPGPAPTGKCPRVGHRGVVACAGCRIAASDADPEYWLIHVPAGSRHCPLAWSLEASY